MEIKPTSGALCVFSNTVGLHHIVDGVQRNIGTINHVLFALKCYGQLSRAVRFVIYCLGYGLENEEIVFWFPIRARNFLIPKRPDRLWDLLSFLYSKYQWLFVRSYNSWGMKLINLHLVSRLWMRGAIPLFPLMLAWEERGKLKSTITSV
jgi:hypothetical protein